MSVLSAHKELAQMSERLRSAWAERDEAAAERDKAVAALASLQNRFEELRHAHQLLQEQLALIVRRIAVAKAERVDTTQLELQFMEVKKELDDLSKKLEDAANDNMASAAGDDADDGHRHSHARPKRKPSGRRDLSLLDYPEERIEITDPALEGNCDRAGFEVSYRLGYQRGGPIRLAIARVKYQVEIENPDDGNKRTTLVTAPRPKELYKRGILAPELIAKILSDKYCYGLPCTRQVQMLKNWGIEVDDATMGRYAEDIGASFGAIVQAAIKDARATAFCLSTDATGISIKPEMLAKSDKRHPSRPCHRGHFFVVLADQKHVFFEYKRAHNGEAACDILKGFSGYVQADAHVIYDAVFRGKALANDSMGPAPLEVGCWSHLRRKFWESAMAAQEPVAKEALLRIGKLFELESRWRDKPPKQRGLLRDKVARPLVEDFIDWVHKRAAEVKDVKGLLRTACGYVLRHQEAFKRYLDDGRLNMTNNHSERALRMIAVGRKAWLFFGSDDHAESAANILSLIASCKLHGLEPEKYMAEMIHMLPYWPKDRFLELAPAYWVQTRATLDPAQLQRSVGPIDIPAPPQ